MKPSFVIVGLGNPGAQYEGTRHNVGFSAIDVLSEEFGEGDWQDKQKYSSFIQEARIVTFPILLVKPTTYMNRSGEAVSKIVDFYKLDPSSQILVIVDDIDIGFGEVRFKKSGGPGTHNGLKSIVQIYGEDFPRLRVGIGRQPSGKDLAAWVLSKFSPDERVEMQKVLQGLPTKIHEILVEGNRD